MSPWRAKDRSGMATIAHDSAWQRAAEAVVLPRVQDAAATPRPAEVGISYVELEYRSLSKEQEALWPAEGEQDARPHRVRAAELDAAASATEVLLAESAGEVRQARADHQHAARILAAYVRRESGAKLRYWLCLVVLWLGDAAGVTSAAITNGDLPIIAALLGIASGMAAVCAGLAGVELRDLRQAQARTRDPQSLSDDERRYQRLFVASTGGVPIVRLVLIASLFVIGLLAVGVGTLRASIEGGAAGLTFGLLTAAVAIGSGLLGYATADEVADLLARMEKRVQKAEQHHLHLAASTALADRAAAETSARSVIEEYQLRGTAAARQIDALSFMVQRNNPNVLGHGLPAGESTGVIGRRPRRGGAA